MWLWRFKLYRKWPKSCTLSFFCFSGNCIKEWFLTNWGRDNNTQGVHERSKFWKNFTIRWVRLWTTNKYSFMVNKWFRSIFVGHIHFKKLMKFWKFIEIQSVHRKYNSFFDLKTKRILKFFHFSFFNIKTKIEKWKNFLKFIFWFQIKKWNRKFWFLLFEGGFKSK